MLLSPSLIDDTRGLSKYVSRIVTFDLPAQVGGLLDNADELLQEFCQ